MTNSANQTTFLPLASEKPTTREQILLAALTCFAENGYHQTTMDDIVAASGLSKGTLYWHFNSKKELFAALIEWYMSGYDQEIAHTWSDDMSAANKIRTGMALFVETSEQLIPFIKITLDFWAQTPDDEQLQRLFDTLLNQFQGQLSAVIEAGIASGEFRPVNAPQLALAMIGMIDSLALYTTLLGDRIDMRTSFETTLEVIIRGLQQTGSSSGP